MPIHRMLNELVHGNEKDDFRLAAKMAFLFFGRAKLPEQIESLALTYLKRALGEPNQLKSESRAVFSNREEKHSWRAYAEGLLDLYDQLMDIDGIIHGRDRMKREPVNQHFGVTLEFLKDVRLIVKGEW